MSKSLLNSNTKNYRSQLFFWEKKELATDSKRDKMSENATGLEVTSSDSLSNSHGEVKDSMRGKAKGKARAKKAANIGSKKKMTKTSKARRPFPLHTLEEALIVPTSIKEKNRGKPFDTENVAKACGLSRKGPAFFYLAASSRDYGLTDGSRDTANISLLPLGNDIVYAESPAQLHQSRIKAFFNIPLFKAVFEHYGAGDLPEMAFVSSVLTKKFDLDDSLHEDFCNLYQKNCKFLSLTDAQDGLQVVRREGEGSNEAVVLGQPGKYSRQAFIIMPFSEKGVNPRPEKFFNEVLSSLIKPACNAADFGVETARSHGSDLIHHTIISQLDIADLVIADLTDHNPNVLFELGVRIALDKPVLLIRAKGTLPIFDVDNLLRVSEYDPRLWLSTIEEDIAAMTVNVKSAWENKDKNPSYMRILKSGQLTPTSK